jgi:hypothetical protein
LRIFEQLCLQGGRESRFVPALKHLQEIRESLPTWNGARAFDPSQYIRSEVRELASLGPGQAGLCRAGAGPASFGRARLVGGKHALSHTAPSASGMRVILGACSMHAGGAFYQVNRRELGLSRSWGRDKGDWRYWPAYLQGSGRSTAWVARVWPKAKLAQKKVANLLYRPRAT